MALNFTTLFIGILFFVGTVLALVWVLSLRGIFRKQIYLQRQLFFCIMMAYLTRTLQHLVLNQICHGARREEAICSKWLVHLNQFFDLLASTFNFTVYLILSCFWAEQVSSMRSSALSGFDSISGKNNFNSIRKRVNLSYWVTISIIYSVLTMFMTATLTLRAEWYSRFWVTGRVIFRVMLSLGITVLLAIFGYLMRSSFKRYFATKSGLGRIAIITLLCGLAYLVLSTCNVILYLISTFGNGIYRGWGYQWIVVNTLALIEWSSHAVLLILLTPKILQQVIEKLFCFPCHMIEKRRQSLGVTPRGRHSTTLAFATLDEEYLVDEKGNTINYYTTPSIDIKNLRSSLMSGEDMPGGQFSTSFGQHDHNLEDESDKDEYDEHFKTYN